MESKKIYVERETFEMNEQTYFSYFIKGTVRGKGRESSGNPAR